MPYVRAAVVTHVLDLGWHQLLDRSLLERADGSFDVVVTVDRSIPDQQNLSRYRLALIIMRTPANTTPRLSSMTDELNRLIRQIKPGETVKLFAPGFRPRDYSP